MNSLRNKIFLLLVSIITLFIIILIIIFNVSIYNNEFRNTTRTLMRIASARELFNFNQDNSNAFIMDNEVYEVCFDPLGNISKIIDYNNNGLTDLEIYELIKKNANRINKEKNGSLYLHKYMFGRNSRGNLIILNNNDVQKYLIKTLIKSVFLFFFLEGGIVLLSYAITKWITKPVQEAFLKQKQFIYDASHELKTPIAIITASVETLENNPREKKWLQSIKTENERMSKLVTDLLDLSKSENISKVEKFENNNLSKIIENSALLFEGLMFEQGLSLDINIEKNIYFNCNSERMKELLNILIDNAIKHAYHDSTVMVSLLKEKNNIILLVKNKGDEIPVSERDKIFERFYRGDKSRNRDSNRYGLGLSIAKNIVENHHGNIKVTCYDSYTSFIVVFKQN